MQPKLFSSVIKSVYSVGPVLEWRELISLFFEQPSYKIAADSLSHLLYISEAVDAMPSALRTEIISTARNMRVLALEGADLPDELKRALKDSWFSYLLPSFEGRARNRLFTSLRAGYVDPLIR